MSEDLRTVRLEDLTVAQITDIELDPKVDSAFDDWGKRRADGGPRSKMWMFARVLAAGNGLPVDTVSDMSLEDMMAMVQLEDPTEPPQPPS